MIGTSEGNGHPYSFSAIFNGYDEEGMSQSQWKNIHNYLKARDRTDFGINDSCISHIWTQNFKESQNIAKASNIPSIVTDYTQMIDHVDAVIIGRDDWISHRNMAAPFLENGKYVFIDKPLSLDTDDLHYFTPYLEQGQLMSTSSIRYSPELDILKRDLSDFGNIKLIKGTVVKNWEKYAIHMLEGIYSIHPFEVATIKKNNCFHESFTIETKEGFLIEINCLGNQSPLALRIEFYSDRDYYRADCLDVFSAFKRTMQHFVKMIKTGQNPIDSSDTLALMDILKQGARL